MANLKNNYWILLIGLVLFGRGIVEMINGSGYQYAGLIGWVALLLGSALIARELHSRSAK